MSDHWPTVTPAEANDFMKSKTVETAKRASGSLDPVVSRLREQYTLCKPCCVDGEPDAHTVWLKVGVQSFCVTSFACETKDEAEWTRDMLAKALATVVAESANNKVRHGGENQ